MIPVLWYGAVEFGLVHPIRTTEFKSALHLMGIVLFLVFLTLYNDVLREKLPKKDKEEEEKPKAETPASTTA